MCWHLPQEWLVDDSENSERPDENHSAPCQADSVYVRSTLFCRATLLSHTQGSAFPFVFPLWFPTPALPAEAAALLAEARVTSAGIFCPPRGSPRSPCNPSHSCRFDTFLYKGNTSRGRNFCPVKSWTEWQSEILDGVENEEKYNAMILMDT